MKEMSLFSFAILICFAYVSFIGYALSEEQEMTEFGEKVKSVMSNETYDKMFNANVKNDEELKEAIKKSVKKFYELFDFSYDEDEEEEVEKENEDLGYRNVTSARLFASQTYAISKVFKELGKLTSDNIDDLVQKYVDAFDKEAKKLEKDDAVSKFIALVTAVANFLKSQDVTSEENVKKCEKAFSEKFKNYKE